MSFLDYFKDESLSVIDICNQIFYSNIELFISIKMWNPFYNEINRFFDQQIIQEINQKILKSKINQN